MVDKRNSDFHDLEKRLNFDSGIAAYDIASTNETASLGLSIYESDLLVWMVSILNTNFSLVIVLINIDTGRLYVFHLAYIMLLTFRCRFRPQLSN